MTYEGKNIDRAEKALLYKYRQCTLCEIAMFANFKYMYHVSRCRNKLIITTERFIYWMKQIYSLGVDRDSQVVGKCHSEPCQERQYGKALRPRL